MWELLESRKFLRECWTQSKSSLPHNRLLGEDDICFLTYLRVNHSTNGDSAMEESPKSTSMTLGNCILMAWLDGFGLGFASFRWWVHGRTGICKSRRRYCHTELEKVAQKVPPSGSQSLMSRKMSPITSPRVGQKKEPIKTLFNCETWTEARQYENPDSD